MLQVLIISNFIWYDVPTTTFHYDFRDQVPTWKAGIVIGIY